jgi:hypothetical protein
MSLDIQELARSFSKLDKFIKSAPHEDPETIIRWLKSFKDASDKLEARKNSVPLLYGHIERLKPIEANRWRQHI